MKCLHQLGPPNAFQVVCSKCGAQIGLACKSPAKSHVPPHRVRREAYYATQDVSAPRRNWLGEPNEKANGVRTEKSTRPEARDQDGVPEMWSASEPALSGSAQGGGLPS